MAPVPLQIAVHRPPTIATDGAANTIAAAATKLGQDRPGTPCKYIPTNREWDTYFPGT